MQFWDVGISGPFVEKGKPKFRDTVSCTGSGKLRTKPFPSHCQGPPCSGASRAAVRRRRDTQAESSLFSDKNSYPAQTPSHLTCFPPSPRLHAPRRQHPFVPCVLNSDVSAIPGFLNCHVLWNYLGLACAITPTWNFLPCPFHLAKSLPSFNSRMPSLLGKLPRGPRSPLFSLCSCWVPV